MQKKSIELKSGGFTFLVLYLHNNNMEFINKYLYEKVKEHPNFFKNAPIIVNVSGLLNIIYWKKIKKIIMSHGFLIVGITGCKNHIFKKMFFDSGLPILSESKKNQLNIHDKKINVLYNEPDHNTIKKTHIINTPVRSGQKIYAQHADLVVTNNVSAGAEIIADGNIHIYGLFRGRVLAGANGDITSKIFCTGLFAELVSISGEYWLADQIPIQFFGKSAQIFLKNNFLNINTLS